jgi:hypothetical protein
MAIPRTPGPCFSLPDTATTRPWRRFYGCARTLMAPPLCVARCPRSVLMALSVGLSRREARQWRTWPRALTLPHRLRRCSALDATSQWPTRFVPGVTDACARDQTRLDDTRAGRSVPHRAGHAQSARLRCCSCAHTSSPRWRPSIHRGTHRRVPASCPHQPLWDHPGTPIPMSHRSGCLSSACPSW